MLAGLLTGLALGLGLCYLYGRQKDRSWGLALEAVNRSWRDAPKQTEEGPRHLRLV